MAIQGFSTSIWSIACKNSKFGGRLKLWELFYPTIFFRCVIFICSFLIWIFIKKVWLTKDFIFEKHLIFETWKFWNWHLKFWDFETWRFWLEIWNFKSEILKLRILKIKAWNFDHEIWGLDFLKTEDLSLKFGHWECGIENLEFERYLKTLKNIYFFFFLFWLTQLLAEFLVYGPKFWPLTSLFLPFFFFASSFINFSSSINTIHLLLPLDFSSSSHHFFSQKTLF